MKKHYVKPETTVIAISTEPVMNLAVSGHVPDPGEAQGKENPFVDNTGQDYEGFVTADTDGYHTRSLWDE